MPKFIIERDLPGAAQLSAEELAVITQTSNKVLKEMGLPYHWVQSFVAGDKIYCIHIAPDEDAVREHAQRGGFPADLITEVKAIIDPATTSA
jgi:hypothetical protein